MVFSYNPEMDSLMIYSEKAKNEPIAGSIVFNNLAFDIGPSGSFLSLEIDNASEVFNAKPSDLQKIKNAKIKTSVSGNAIYLCYIVNFDNKEYEKALIVPRDKIVLST